MFCRQPSKVEGGWRVESRVVDQGVVCERCACSRQVQVVLDARLFLYSMHIARLMSSPRIMPLCMAGRRVTSFTSRPV